MVMIAGIMQLAMLAPYNNLASSVAAALVPTLLAPHLHKSGSTHCHVGTVGTSCYTLTYAHMLVVPFNTVRKVQL